MLHNKELVSIVLLNWNGRPYVFEALRCAQEQSYPNVEIIVVDNGSVDGSIEQIERDFPSCQVIRNRTNLGYCKGMNQGIAASTGEYVLPLNSDAFLDGQFIERAVLAMQRYDQIGMIAPRVLRYVNGKRTDQVDCVGLMMRWSHKSTQVRPDSPARYVFGSAGACPFLRRAMLQDVPLSDQQYFDETYFAFGEDTDLWFRAQLRGWKCWYQPDIRAWHIHSASVGSRIRLIDKPREFQVHALKNRYLTIFKNLPGALLALQAIPLLAAELIRLLYFVTVAPRTAGHVFRAAWRVAVMWPDVMRLRREIQSRRAVSNRYLLGFFVSL